MTISPEIVDQIIDHAHDDTKPLTACSLTTEDWVLSTRLHLFKKLSLLSAHDVPSRRSLATAASGSGCLALSLDPNKRLTKFTPMDEVGT